MTKQELNLFFRWLKEQGIYVDYFKEIKKNKWHGSTLNNKFNGNIEKCLYETTMREAINHTIKWDETRMGSNFWSSLDTKLRKFASEKGIGKYVKEGTNFIL